MPMENETKFGRWLRLKSIGPAQHYTETLNSEYFDEWVATKVQQFLKYFKNKGVSNVKIFKGKRQ